MQLVLEPGEVKVQVGALHGLRTPAGQFGDDPRGHVDDKAVGAVQQVEEWAPHGLTLARCVLTENLDTAAVLLFQIRFDHFLQLFQLSIIPEAYRRASRGCTEWFGP